MNSQAINKGNTTLYGSVSAKPAAVLLMNAECIPVATAAKNPPRLFVNLFAIKKAGIHANIDIRTGTRKIEDIKDLSELNIDRNLCV